MKPTDNPMSRANAWGGYFEQVCKHLEQQGYKLIKHDRAHLESEIRSLLDAEKVSFSWFSSDGQFTLNDHSQALHQLSVRIVERLFRELGLRDETN